MNRIGKYAFSSLEKLENIIYDGRLEKFNELEFGCYWYEVYDCSKLSFVFTDQEIKFNDLHDSLRVVKNVGYDDEDRPIYENIEDVYHVSPDSINYYCILWSDLFGGIQRQPSNVQVDIQYSNIVNVTLEDNESNSYLRLYLNKEEYGDSLITIRDGDLSCTFNYHNIQPTEVSFDDAFEIGSALNNGQTTNTFYSVTGKVADFFSGNNREKAHFNLVKEVGGTNKIFVQSSSYDYSSNYNGRNATVIGRISKQNNSLSFEAETLYYSFSWF